jgi:hypothetical protein
MNEKPKKRIQIATDVPFRVRRTLEAAAAKEDRTLAQYVRIYLKRLAEQLEASIQEQT